MNRYLSQDKGKFLGSPIQGLLNKFPPGEHVSEVTLISPIEDRVNFLFTLPDGRLHLETFKSNPGLRQGQHTRLVVGHGPGYVVFRLPGGGLQARDGESGKPLAFAETPEGLLEKVRGIPPSVPVIKEILHGGRQLQFELHTAQAAKPNAEDSESPPWD